MSRESTPPISGVRSSPEPAATPPGDAHNSNNGNPTPQNEASLDTHNGAPPLTSRSSRPARACTIRAAARMHSASPAATERKQKPAAKKEQRQEEEEEEESPTLQQCSRIVTPLVGTPEPSQLPRWTLRSMWELASVLNFLHVFRPLLNISVEFSAEEFETALINPNDTLSDVHMPLLKAIPPITRMALTRDTWVTVLCRKLRDWWHWVAEGELPIVASHGAEIEVYKSLDPGVRVVILKALCDIRVEQDDIRNYIDNSLKRGAQLSSFRKERVGGDSQGINYWYEDDPITGHRLYREIRKAELKKGKTKGSQILPSTTYQWETVATNFDEFQDVSEKLFASKNRTEASLGKKLKIDKLPDIEIDHKRKEKLLKKQHRQALLLDNFLNVDGLATGRSMRDRKPVRYTFDDYDRSINEAIKITKRKQPSPEPTQRREFSRIEVSTNGKLSGPSHSSQLDTSSASPKSPDYDDVDEEHKFGPLDRSNRRRQRPQRYSEKEFVEAVSDGDFDSDDDIVGEAIYDEEYLKKRKQRKLSSGSEGDEEYRWEGENAEEEEESLSASEYSDAAPKFKKFPGRTRSRRETKLGSVDQQSSLRRSKRATRNRNDYRKYEFSESETDSMKPEKWSVSNEHPDATGNEESSMGSQDSDDHLEMKVDQPICSEAMEKDPIPTSNSPDQDEVEDGQKRGFLDLNEMAPGSGSGSGSGLDDTVMKDDNAGDL